MSDWQDEDSFWLELREPGCVPERKGRWPRIVLADKLREVMQARPEAYITVVTLGRDGPQFQDGPEALQMADARSMSTGARHIRSTRDAHVLAVLGFAPIPEDGRWPSGCYKPNSCGRHASCMYGASVESCRHYGKDIAAEVRAALHPSSTASTADPDRDGRERT